MADWKQASTDETASKHKSISQSSITVFETKEIDYRISGEEASKFTQSFYTKEGDKPKPDLSSDEGDGGEA